jgi:hypothetical protein
VLGYRSRSSSDTSDYVVIAHDRSANDDDAMTRISARTGAIIDTVTAPGRLGAGSSIEGYTAVPAGTFGGEHAALFVIAPNGTVRAVAIGESNFFGYPW